MKLIIRLVIFIILILFISTNIQAERFDKFIERQGRDDELPKKKKEVLDIIEDPQPLEGQNQDFQIGVEIIGAQKAVGAVTVKGIQSFQIKRADVADENTRYTIIYFLDERPVEVFSQITLPYVLKTNYKGFSKGLHTLGFKVVDQNGNVGIGTIKIIVKH